MDDNLPLSATASRRLRIVHVVLDLQAGGLERMVADLISRLDPARFEVHLLALRFLGRNAEGLGSYCGLHVAPPLSAWSMILPPALAAQLQRLAPDILHTHSGAWYKTSLAARLIGIAHIVHTDHGRQFPVPLATRFIDNLASRWTSAVVAVSAPLAVPPTAMTSSWPGSSWGWVCTDIVHSGSCRC